MTKTLITLLLGVIYSWPAISMAQEVDNLKIEVTGSVIDSLNNEPIPYASVSALLMPNQTCIARTVPHRNGTFLLKLNKDSQYAIIISCIGMKTVTKNIKTGTSPINLHHIMLEEDSQQLGEVEVIAKKQRISLTDNGFSYSFKNDKTLLAENLLYAMKKVPLVSVSGDGTLSVKGGSNYVIYLNGKPYTLANSNPKEVLQSIPASSIEKVEVITNPDLRYGMSEGGSILNIITLKNQPNNYRIILNAGGNTHPAENAGVNILFTKDKLSASFGYSFNNTQLDHVPSSSYTETFLNETDKTVTTQEWETDGNITNHLIKGLLEYNIDTLNSVYADANFMLQRINMNTIYNNNYQTPSNPYYHSNVFDKINQHDGAREINLSYRNLYPHKKRERFLLTYRYAFNPDNKKNNVTERSFTDSENKDSYNEYIHKANTKGGLTEHTVQADYTIPLNKHTLSIGAKDIYRRSTSSPLYYEWNPETGTWIEGNKYAQNEIDKFKQKQNIWAAYLSYQLRLNQFSFSAGARIENTYNKIEYSNEKENEYSYHTFDWIPRLFLSYTLSQYSSLSLSYSSLIKRASIWQMNPYQQQVDEFSVEYGNPDIRSEKINQMNLSYYYFSNSVTFATWLDYSNTDNAIVKYPSQQNEKTIAYTYDNLGSYHKITGSIYISYSPTEALSFNINGRVGKTYMKSTRLDFKQHATHYSLNLSGDWNLKNDWTIGAQWGVFQQEPEMQIAYNKFQKYSCYVQKRMLDNKLNIRLNINSPFRNEKYREAVQHVQNSNFSRQTRFGIVARSVMIDLSYSFGSGKTSAKRKVIINNDDLLQNTGVR